jgi:voltage-gated potassium channel
MGRVNPVERRVERFLREPPSVRNAAAVIVTVTAAVVIGTGAVMAVIDSAEYPNLGVGMWWALQTVTTVGYGDVAPTHFAGRLVGAAVMLEGTAFIAIVTAVITSSFVARAARDQDVALEREDKIDFERMEQRFDALERKLDLLTATGATGARAAEPGD